MIAEERDAEQFPELPAEARCLDCGYRLYGLPGRICPECGRAFDPNQPLSFRMPAPSWWQRWSKPPPLWHVLPLIVTTLLFINATTKPKGLYTLIFPCVLFFVLLVIPLDYVSRVVAVAYCRSRVNTLVEPSRRNRWRWYVMPVCGLIMILFAVSDWPLRARFHLSRSAFGQAVKDCNAGRAIGTPRWIGLYRVEQILIHGPNNIGFVTGSSFIDPTGFEYSPQRPSSSYSQEIAPGWFAQEW